MYRRRVLLRLCSRRLPRARALLLPLRDLRLGRDEPAAREVYPRLAAETVLLQPLLELVRLERVLRVDTQAEYSDFAQRAG